MKKREIYVVKFYFFTLEHCEKTDLTCFCQDCSDSFCSECFQNEHRSLKKRKHEKKQLEEKIEKCSTHHETFKYYCFYCDVEICPSCVLSLHKEHYLELFENSMKPMKDSALLKLEKCEKSLIEYLNIKEKTYSSHQEEFKTLKNEINEEKQKIESLENLSQKIPSFNSFHEVYKVSKDLNMILYFSGIFKLKKDL